MRLSKSLTTLFPLLLIVISCSVAPKDQSALPAASLDERAPAAEPKTEASRNQLSEIMKTCVANFRAHHLPAPCVSVDLTQGEQKGFVILKDRKGKSHFLLIPSRKITGIEDPILLSKDTPNYWEQAYRNLSFVVGTLGQQMPIDHFIIGINSVYARSQDQFHMHLECLAPEVLKWLKTDGKLLQLKTEETVTFKRAKFRVWKIKSNEFINPFVELAGRISFENADLKKHALALVTISKSDGSSEFFIFDSTSGPEGSTYRGGSADLLMDRKCSIQSDSLYQETQKTKEATH